MPAKKEFSTAEEAAEYIEFLRRRNRERANADNRDGIILCNNRNDDIILFNSSYFPTFLPSYLPAFLTFKCKLCSALLQIKLVLFMRREGVDH